jgi:hypothetical protein
MRSMSCLLLLILFCADVQGQIFGRRRREYIPCPDGYCSPSPSYPSLPKAETDEVTPEEIQAGLVVVPPLDARPRNVSGQCVFMAAEPMLVTAGYEEFRGWAHVAVKERWHGAWVDNLLQACKAAGIPMKEERRGDYEIFEYAKAEGVPVYVQIAMSRPNDHAVCVCGFSDKYVWVLDNNGPPIIRRWSRDKFRNKWNGIAACPLKRKHGREKNPRPIDTTPARPIEPTKPTEPAKPIAVEPAKPCPEVKQIITKVDELSVGMLKLTDATSKLAENVGGLGARVSSVEDRLAAAEKARCACSGAGHGSAPPPSATPCKDYGPDLAKMQDELARLKQSLKTSGTLTIQIDPSPKK